MTSPCLSRNTNASYFQTTQLCRALHVYYSSDNPDNMLTDFKYERHGLEHRFRDNILTKTQIMLYFLNQFNNEIIIF